MIAPFQALATIGLEAILIYSAARTPGPYRLRGLAILNLILVALCAPKLFDIGGLVTNVTSIMHAAVFFIQGVIIMNFGKRATYWTIEMAIFTLLSFFAIWFMICQFPSAEIAASIDYSSALAVITASMTKNILASLTSFIISTVVMVEIYTYCRNLRYHKGLCYSLGMVAGQFVDSILFFTVAFHLLPTGKQFELMITSFILKVALGFCYLPVVGCINRRIDQTRTGDHSCPILNDQTSGAKSVSN